MESQPDANSSVWSFPFTEQDWEQTPPAVQAYLHTLRDERGQLQERIENLEARLQQHSTTSSRPPSSDSPYKKPRRRTESTGARKGGSKPGHQGHRQVLLAPTTGEEVMPDACVGGSGEFGVVSPYYTHQVIELPRIELEVSHWVLYRGQCLACGRWGKAPVPAEQTTGDGPRFSALMAELAGTYGNGRRMVQRFCSSVLGVPISLGAIQSTQSQGGISDFACYWSQARSGCCPWKKLLTASTRT
jgi:transposase